MAETPPPPLVVKISQSHASLLEVHLLLYFSSPKHSGGGECEVQVCDRGLGVYTVQFQSEEVRTRVKEHGHHSIEVRGSVLEITILPDYEQAQMDLAETQHTKDLISSAPGSFPLVDPTLHQKDTEKKMSVENYPRDTPEISKQIFPQVSATLNTDLFTKDERRQMTELCPGLKIELWTTVRGIEKVSGEYSSIKKLHSQFERLLQRPSQTQQNRRENDVEKLEVSSAIFEYFSLAYKKEIDDLEQKFSVKIISKKCGGGSTSIQFLSDGSPNLVEEAQQTFASTFQKAAANLMQERIPFTDHIKLAKALELIVQWKKDRKLLVKREQTVLILWGPTNEISAAKEYIQEKEQESLVKKAQVPSLKNSFEIDVDIYVFLELEFMKRIESINRMYGTSFEKRPCLNSHKFCVIFKPEPFADKDRSSEAYERFLHVYEKILAEPKEKLIPLSGNQEKKLDLFFAQLKEENPKVRMEKRRDGLLLCGLPEHVCSTEKHIMSFLQNEVTPYAGNVWESLPSSSFGQNSQSSLEQKKDQKIYSSAIKEQLHPKGEEVKEEMCSIYMDKIHQKKVLPEYKHEFCTKCNKETMKHKHVCPLHNVPFGKIEGNLCPGTMEIITTQYSLPGYEKCGTIEISYKIPSGTQAKGNEKLAAPYSDVDGTRESRLRADKEKKERIFQKEPKRSTGPHTSEQIREPRLFMDKKKKDAKATTGLHCAFEQIREPRFLMDKRKIFLKVSAILNTGMFTNEERRQMTTFCPDLNIDLCTILRGIEKVSGDFDSIVGLYFLFEGLLQLPGLHHKDSAQCEEQKSTQESSVKNHENERKKYVDKLEESSPSIGQSSGEQSNVEDHQNGKRNDVDRLEVPSAIFEYFSQACKGQIDDLEQNFRVKIISKECGGERISIQFLSDQNPSLVEEAQQAFVSTFQKVAANLTQERIPFTDTSKLTVAFEMITQWNKDKKLLVKREGMALILRGPPKEITAAKENIQKKEQESLGESPQVPSLENGFEIHADIYIFLELALMEEIEIIKKTYCTTFEKQLCPSGHKFQVLFKPEPFAHENRSLEAYKRFFHIYQKILAEPREKLIPLSGNQEKKLDLFFAQLKEENPKVKMEKKKDGLLLYGLPEHVCSTEKHIMYFLQNEVNPYAGNVWESLPSFSFGETPRSSLEQKKDQKIYSLAVKEQLHPKGEEVKEELCSICMDKIHQKKVLPKCKHGFCTKCIDKAMEHKPACPLCNSPYGKVEGNLSPGTKHVTKTQYSLPCYESCIAIEIFCNVPSDTHTISLSAH